MQTAVRTIACVLAFSAWLGSDPGFAQGESTTQRTSNALPDWSGAWSMVGGTVFDRGTQTGQGGATSAGVRSHPPYNCLLYTSPSPRD